MLVPIVTATGAGVLGGGLASATTGALGEAEKRAIKDAEAVHQYCQLISIESQPPSLGFSMSGDYIRKSGQESFKRVTFRQLVEDDVVKLVEKPASSRKK